MEGGGWRVEGMGTCAGYVDVQAEGARVLWAIARCDTAESSLGGVMVKGRKV